MKTYISLTHAQTRTYSLPSDTVGCLLPTCRELQVKTKWTRKWVTAVSKICKSLVFSWRLLQFFSSLVRYKVAVCGPRALVSLLPLFVPTISTSHVKVVCLQSLHGWDLSGYSFEVKIHVKWWLVLFLCVVFFPRTQQQKMLFQCILSGYFALNWSKPLQLCPLIPLGAVTGPGLSGVRLLPSPTHATVCTYNQHWPLWRWCVCSQFAPTINTTLSCPVKVETCL